ncbi:hypothetical protein ACJZ2D_007756 [Fusarium nematophilum]
MALGLLLFGSIKMMPPFANISRKHLLQPIATGCSWACVFTQEASVWIAQVPSLSGWKDPSSDEHPLWDSRIWTRDRGDDSPQLSQPRVHRRKSRLALSQVPL